MIDVNNIPVSNDPRRINLEGPVLVAHQAEFMPWLGFISKASMGDVFLILDDTQFKKDYFENRNKIRFHKKEGWQWLNVPVKNKHKLPNMMDMKVTDLNWKKKHLNSIKQSYSKAPYFDEIYGELESIYNNIDCYKLVEINIKLIKYAFKKFKIDIPVLRVSELKKNGKKIEGESTDLIVSLANVFNAKSFVAGVSGRNYLDVDKFRINNINLVFQDFRHPEYTQIHGSFIPCMSFIDLLFNHPQNMAIKILGKSNYVKGLNK